MYTRKNVLLDLEAGTKNEAIGEIVEFLRKNEVLDDGAAKELHKGILSREKIGSTGIGNGVAVPHAKVPKLPDVVVGLARSAAGLDYHSVDGEPVHILFVVGSPPEAADLHLSVLKWISRLGRNADFRSFLLRAKNVREVQGLLKEMGDE